MECKEMLSGGGSSSKLSTASLSNKPSRATRIAKQSERRTRVKKCKLQSFANEFALFCKCERWRLVRGADLLKLCRLKLDKIGRKTARLQDGETAGRNKSGVWRVESEELSKAVLNNIHQNRFIDKVCSLSWISSTLRKFRLMSYAQSAQFRRYPAQVPYRNPLFHWSLFTSRKRCAFTLAEVLITLGVIGVVAAVAMPSMITNITERRNSERQANIAYKITQAMEHMRATGTLVQYDSTESFVNELRKHLKIAKVCDKDHLTECWPTDKVIGSDGKEYNVADAKTGPKLGINTKTNNVGIVLADGAPLILNYDNTTQGFDIGTPVRASNIDLPVGGGKTKSFAYTTSVTGAIDFVMDVNGKAKPNREMTQVLMSSNEPGYSAGAKKNVYYDIRSFKTASFSNALECGSAGCIKYLGTSYSAVNCSDSSSDDYKYCKPTPSGYSNDYWAGAKKACDGKGMKLPTHSELGTIYQKRGEYPSLSSNTHSFWSATEGHDAQYDAMYVYFGNGVTYGGSKYLQGSVVCSGN